MSDTFDKTLDMERLDKIRRVMPAFLDALGLEQKRAYNAGVSMELLPAVDNLSRPRYLTAELPDGADGTPRELHVLAYIANPYESCMDCAIAYVRCADPAADAVECYLYPEKDKSKPNTRVCARHKGGMGVEVGTLKDGGIAFDSKIAARCVTFHPADLRALADWLEKRVERGQA